MGRGGARMEGRKGGGGRHRQKRRRKGEGRETEKWNRGDLVRVEGAGRTGGAGIAATALFVRGVVGRSSGARVVLARINDPARGVWWARALCFALGYDVGGGREWREGCAPEVGEGAAAERSSPVLVGCCVGRVCRSRWERGRGAGGGGTEVGGGAGGRRGVRWGFTLGGGGRGGLDGPDSCLCGWVAFLRRWAGGWGEAGWWLAGKLLRLSGVSTGEGGFVPGTVPSPPDSGAQPP
uniref:Uncharacterized protein n=1 Tax=Knipowitschia caucasica TaxID=637954 RepID=A0AAV2MTI2_KNICA